MCVTSSKSCVDLMTFLYQSVNRLLTFSSTKKLERNIVEQNKIKIRYIDFESNIGPTKCLQSLRNRNPTMTVYFLQKIL